MRNESRVRKILPVNLMLEGRPCLVVGSGQIAARKVGHLLEAGASITVVGPDACEAIQRWTGEKRIQYRPRPFRNADVKGQWLVLAATDNGNVNGAVIRLCQQKGILCSAADAHWTKSDFLVPATLRRPHITLTLSTGGESCRRARVIKDYLARHIDGLQQADLLVVSVKRPARASQRAVRELGAVLQQIWGVFEFVIFNRADRIEVLAVVSAQTSVAAKLLRDCVCDRFPGRCCIQEGAAAVEHGVSGLLKGTKRAAAGTEPAPPVGGTTSVSSGVQVAQGAELRAALRESTQAGWAGSLMNDWIEAGIKLADKMRGPRAQTMFTGLRKLNREYQRQYESIIRSI